jgi:hypothetical protein
LIVLKPNPSALLLLHLLTGSVSDPHGYDSIGRLDPDLGGLKRDKMKKKTQLKDRLLGITNLKINVIVIKMFTLFFPLKQFLF